MATYREPGTQIIEVQETVNVTAEVSALTAGIIGPAYQVVDILDSDAPVYGWLDTPEVDEAGKATSLTFEIKGVDPAATLDSNSLYIEFVSKTGQNIPFTGTITYSTETKEITVSAETGTLEDLLPNLKSTTSETLMGYRPKVGFRALYTNKNIEVEITSNEDIRLRCGKNSVVNPLGMAASVMNANNPNRFLSYAITSNDTAGFTAAKDALENSAMYAVAPLSQDKTNVLTPFITWANSRSLPENGRPTKLYISPLTTWYGEDNKALTGNQLGVTVTGKNATNFMFSIDQLTKAAKKITSDNIAAGNAQILNSRVVSVHPDMGWKRVTVHVLQTNPTYVESMSGVDGGSAVLVNNFAGLDAGTIVNATIFAKLVASGYQSVEVWFPVAGYINAVQQAALVGAMNPSDPKTQVPVSGVDKISYSEDFFGRAYTNIIAGGGTNVIVQAPGTLPASRHHLTTDMSSIQSREDNILHQVDVVTINFISALKALTGRYKQTPKYYKLLRATLTAFADKFVSKEWVQSVTILEVKQDPNQPDKVLVVLRILPFFAANYIDVTIYY